MTDKRLIPALAALMLLSACGGKKPADDGRSASGEVLEGTISDAMLPVDQVRSQAPLAPPENKGPTEGAAAGPGEEAPAGEGEADPATDEAAETPAAETPAVPAAN